MRLLLVAALITTPQLAYAECADLTPLNQGQTAPCDGVHVKSAAVAKIIVTLRLPKRSVTFVLKSKKISLMQPVQDLLLRRILRFFLLRASTA